MPPRAQPTDPKEILPSLLKLVESNAYSAHQKTRTTAIRLSQHGHPQSAVEVLVEVSKALLKKGEVGSGVDLVGQLVGVWEGCGESVNEGSRGKLTNLIALCPSTGNWRKTVIDLAINWTAKPSTPDSKPAGDPLLLLYIGQLLSSPSTPSTFLHALPYLISSGTPDAALTLGRLGFNWSQLPSPTPPAPLPSPSPSNLQDPSAYLLKTVLPFLLLPQPNIKPALITLQTFRDLLIQHSPSILLERVSGPRSASGEEVLFTSVPVLNWLQVVVMTVQRAPGEGVRLKEAWQELTGREYRSWGKTGGLRDENVKEAVAFISKNYFQIQPPRGAGGPNLMDLMGSMFGGAK